MQVLQKHTHTHNIKTHFSRNRMECSTEDRDNWRYLLNEAMGQQVYMPRGIPWSAEKLIASQGRLPHRVKSILSDTVMPDLFCLVSRMRQIKCAEMIPIWGIGLFNHVTSDRVAPTLLVFKQLYGFVLQKLCRAASVLVLVVKTEPPQKTWYRFSVVFLRLQANAEILAEGWAGEAWEAFNEVMLCPPPPMRRTAVFCGSERVRVFVVVEVCGIAVINCVDDVLCFAPWGQ